MIFIAQIIYAVLCIFFAKLNALWIAENKKILHGINGFVHLVVWALLYFLVHKWQLFLVLPFIGRFVFDTALNYFRGFSIYYIPINPKSIIDRIEKLVFDYPQVAKIFYIVSIVILNIVFIVHKV
jgi:hypothetical protein